MRSHELLSFLESCEQGLFMKNNEQQHDIDLNVYKAMTVVNENAFSNVAVSAYTALTNSSFGYHTRAIEVAYNEYIDFSSSRKDMAEDLKRYSGNSDLLPKLNGMMALPLNFSIVEAIRPKFLLDYAYNLRDIARSSSPAKMDAEVRRIKSNDIASRLKPNCVKLSHDVLSEKFDQIDFRSYCVPVDLKYLSDAALYCANLKSTNKELNVIVAQTTSVLREVQSVIEELIPVVYDTKNTAPEAGSKSIQFVYNALKLLIDMGSYISRALVYMIKIYSVKIISISKIFDAIVSVQAITPTMEATIELNTVNATDTESVANDLRSGRADVFDDFANKLYEFHRNLLENTRYDKTKDVDSIIADHQYNRKAYDDTSKIYIMLSHGLDIISRKSDDYLIVFDHIIEEAGFQIRLEDKYRNILDSLDDVSVYRSASDLSNSGEMNLDVYLMIINEIGDFSANITTIAKNAFDSYEKLIGLKKRFDENIYGEYKNAEAINQLKIFFEDLVDQYKKLTNIIASKMLLRLKSMGMYADDLSRNITDNTDTVISVPQNNIEDDDFTNYAFKVAAESADIFSTAEMIFCQEAYLESRMRRDTGADSVILEASPETNNNATTTNGDGNNNVKNDGSLKTNASVVDNSEDAQAAKQVQNKSSKFGLETIKKICDSIRNWFMNMLTSFKNIMSRKFVKDGFVTGPDGRKLTYQQFLKTYKEYLLSKNYTNTEIRILPYQSMDDIISQIASVKNNVIALKGDAINSVASEQDMYKKLFPFVSNMKGDINAMKTQLSTFVTVGKQKAQDLVYKNNEVADWVKKTIPVLENYQTNYAAKLDADLRGLEKELENTTKTYQEAVTELFESIYSIYTEADAPATGTPATGTPNTGTNTQQASAGQQVHPVGSAASQQKNGEDTVGIQAKANWMRTAVMYFCGVCCNVVRDKIQNSFKILAGFSDKANKAISAKNAEKQNGETQDNNQATTESVNDMFQDMFDSILEAVGTKPNRPKKAMTESDVRKVEKKYGFKYPASLRKYLLGLYSLRPDNQAAIKMNGISSDIKFFLSCAAHDYYSADKSIERYRKDLLSILVPFAGDSFGNDYCFDPESGKIYFMDHERTGDPDLLAKSFDDFVKNISTDNGLPHNPSKIGKEQVKNVLNRFLIYMKRYNVVPDNGVPSDLAHQFAKIFYDMFAIDIPDDYLTFLTIVNGIEFDGLVFYGIDGQYIHSNKIQRNNGLITNNKIWTINKPSKRIVLGENDMDLYIYDAKSKKYVIEDKNSHSTLSSHVSFNDMLVNTLTKVMTESVDDTFDSVLEAVGTDKQKNTDWKYKVDLVDKNVFKEIEKTRGIKIPGGLKQFIIAHNAASPTAEKFEVEGKERVFGDVLSFNQNESDTDSGYTALQSVRDKNLFPFAVDPFGNYICYNISKNCVDFLDHGTDKVVSTRKSLSAFINSLH